MGEKEWRSLKEIKDEIPLHLRPLTVAEIFQLRQYLGPPPYPEDPEEFWEFVHERLPGDYPMMNLTSRWEATVKAMEWADRALDSL